MYFIWFIFRSIRADGCSAYMSRRESEYFGLKSVLYNDPRRKAPALLAGKAAISKTRIKPEKCPMWRERRSSNAMRGDCVSLRIAPVPRERDAA